MADTAPTPVVDSTTAKPASLLNSIRRWYANKSDAKQHPRLAFLIEYVEGLAVTMFVYVVTRATYAILSAVDHLLPTAAPDDAHWYLPMSFIRTLVTIIDSVALLFIAISSGIGLFRLSRELWGKKVVQ